MNHVAQNCYNKKTEEYKPNFKNQRDQVNMVLDGEPSIRCESKHSLVNLTYGNNDWWLDSGANVHVCFNHTLFKNYQKSSEEM